MCRYEQALCCGDKLQHAPALGEHALTLHVQLVTTILTVRLRCATTQRDMQELQYSRKDKDAFQARALVYLRSICDSVGWPNASTTTYRSRASELHAIFPGLHTLKGFLNYASFADSKNFLGNDKWKFCMSTIEFSTQSVNQIECAKVVD